MAFYIELFKKNKENEIFINYEYQFSVPVEEYKNVAGKTRCKSKLVQGEIKIDPRTAEVHIVKLAEGDKGLYVQRAASVLKKYAEKGDFPDKACWAS